MGMPDEPHPLLHPRAQPETQLRSPLMPFGKYKGSLLKDVPSEYLLWLGCLHDLRQPLLGAVLREMGRRIVEMDQQAATGGDANAGRGV